MDGMLGQFKAGLDGLSDALGVDDSGWSLSIARGDKVPGGQIIVEISERDAQ
jgi:crossover junction endodeoxyribonuclease RusA